MPEPKLKLITDAQRKSSNGFLLVAGDSGYYSTPLRFAACRWNDELECWLTHSRDRFTDGGSDALYYCALPELDTTATEASKIRQQILDLQTQLASLETDA